MKQCRVLMVDDDADDRFIFEMALRECAAHAELQTAYDGIHALEVLEAAQPGVPDIIFLDINMPRLNGKELLPKIRQMHGASGVPVIAYSTSATPADVEAMLAVGASSYVIKPSSFGHICDAIRDALERHALL